MITGALRLSADHPDVGVRIGMDLVEISEVARSISDFGDRYLRRVFAEHELLGCRTHSGDPDVERLAARFAAKEATIKALDIADATELTHIVVVNAANGRPELQLLGVYARRSHELGAFAVDLTLTHERNYAAATVIILTNNCRPGEHR